MNTYFSAYKKTFIIVLLLFVMGISAGALTRMGDVNSDGTVSIIDSLLIARYSVGLPVSAFDINAADFSCNGTTDINDALLVARFAAGLAPDSACQPTPPPTLTPTPTSTIPPLVLSGDQLATTSYAIGKTLPESEFVIPLLYTDEDPTSVCNWQLNEVPGTSAFSLSETAGTLDCNTTMQVIGTLNWSNLSPGQWKYNFYLYAVTTTNKRFCKLISVLLTVPGPTPTPSPCGYPRPGLTYEPILQMTYPETSFSLTVTETGTSSYFSVISPAGQPATALTFVPAQGSVSYSTWATVTGTLDWTDIPVGGTQDYYAIVRLSASCNYKPTWHLISVRAVR